MTQRSPCPCGPLKQIAPYLIWRPRSNHYQEAYFHKRICGRGCKLSAGLIKLQSIDGFLVSLRTMDWLFLGDVPECNMVVSVTRHELSIILPFQQDYWFVVVSS